MRLGAALPPPAPPDVVTFGFSSQLVIMASVAANKIATVKQFARLIMAGLLVSRKCVGMARDSAYVARFPISRDGIDAPAHCHVRCSPDGIEKRALAIETVFKPARRDRSVPLRKWNRARLFAGGAPRRRHPDAVRLYAVVSAIAQGHRRTNKRPA